jgi:hypothetical protein
MYGQVGFDLLHQRSVAPARFGILALTVEAAQRSRFIESAGNQIPGDGITVLLPFGVFSRHAGFLNLFIPARSTKSDPIGSG